MLAVSLIIAVFMNVRGAAFQKNYHKIQNEVLLRFVSRKLYAITNGPLPVILSATCHPSLRSG
jgi:hypothetical protein